MPCTVLGYFACLFFVTEAPFMGYLHDYLALLGALVLLCHCSKGCYLHNLLAFLGVFLLLGYHPNKDYLHSYLGAVCVFALFVRYPSNGDNGEVDEEDDPAAAASYVSIA